MKGSIILVGAGGMGAVHHANWQHIEGAEVLAVVGKGEGDEARAKAWHLPLYGTLSEALKEKDANIVDICTPSFLHADYIRDAFKLKKQVIVEKPVALSSKEAKAAYREATKAERQLYVAQVVQFTKPIMHLREITKSGIYGNVRSAHFVRLSAAPAWSESNWLYAKEKSGLIPYDLHIHDLDVLVSLFGKPDSAEAFPSKGAFSRTCDHYDFLYRWKERTITAEASWYPASSFPFDTSFRVAYDKAVVVSNKTGMFVYPDGREPVILDTKDEILIPTGINVPPTGWYYNELTHFLTCAKANRPSPFVTEEQVVGTLETLESMEF
jgi:UDP-N-acetylglucosamine 3-dehydrogenase